MARLIRTVNSLDGRFEASLCCTQTYSTEEVFGPIDYFVRIRRTRLPGLIRWLTAKKVTLATHYLEGPGAMQIGNLTGTRIESADLEARDGYLEAVILGSKITRFGSDSFVMACNIGYDGRLL